VVTRYPARTHEGDLQNMTDQNAQAGPESKPDADGVSRRSSLAGFGAPDNWVISQIKQTSPVQERVQDRRLDLRRRQQVHAL
jgi:hypothetical protein